MPWAGVFAAGTVGAQSKAASSSLLEQSGSRNARSELGPGVACKIAVESHAQIKQKAVRLDHSEKAWEKLHRHAG